MTPFNIEEQQLFSKLSTDDDAPYFIPKAEFSQPNEGAHFSFLSLGFCSFGHDHAHKWDLECM